MLWDFEWYFHVRQVPSFLDVIFLQAFQSLNTAFLNYYAMQEIVQYLCLYHIYPTERSHTFS